MHPDIHFVHARTRDSLGEPVHAVFAHPCGRSTPDRGQLINSDAPDAGEGSCGVLLWTEEGTLKLVGVQVPWRRKGVATALWHQAHRISEVPLNKAPIRTALGEAWLQSLGIDVPLEVLNTPMTSLAEASGATPKQLALDDKESTALRLSSLLGKRPDALPYIRVLCAPTYEEAAEQMSNL